MVASPHVLASASGVAALRAGGNALDAAIAAAATIAVVYPHMNGLGGDNVWLIHDAGSGALRALRGMGRSARAASIAWYAARGIDAAIPSRGGAAALTVPGVVDGWWSAHEYSRATMGSPLGWRDLLADAIVYAREGFSASDGQRTPPPREPDLFGPEAAPEIRRDLWPLYHPDALARGPLIQTDLARTIEAVAAGGAEAFYRGDVGRRIVAAACAAGSPLAIEDFAEHRSEWVEPLTIRYGGGVAASFPPPTQGMSALAMLGMSEAFDMAALPEADYVHVLVEAAKLAFADRDRHLTDPGFMRVSPEELLAPERLKRLAGQISRRRALSPGDAAAAAGDTIAIAAADRAGNAVSLIQSLYFTWGSASAFFFFFSRGGRYRRGPAKSRQLLLPRPGSRQCARPRQADDAHPHTLDVPRGWSGALRLRDDGGRGPAPDAGRPGHAAASSGSRASGRGRGAALALRPHVGHAVPGAQPRGALPARPRARPGRTGSRRRGRRGLGRPVRPRPVHLALAGRRGTGRGLGSARRRRGAGF